MKAVYFFVFFLIATNLFGQITNFTDHEGILRIESVKGSAPCPKKFIIDNVSFTITDIGLNGDELNIDVFIENKGELAIKAENPWVNLILVKDEKQYRSQSINKNDNILINPKGSAISSIAFPLPPHDLQNKRFQVTGVPTFCKNPINFSFAWWCWIKPSEIAIRHETRPPSNIQHKTINGPFIGNTKTKVYHQPGCPKIRHCINCDVEFANSDEAESAGYRPCETCIK